VGLDKVWVFEKIRTRNALATGGKPVWNDPNMDRRQYAKAAGPAMMSRQRRAAARPGLFRKAAAAIQPDFPDIRPVLRALHDSFKEP
jgi:hypothetical protein